MEEKTMDSKSEQTKQNDVTAESAKASTQTRIPEETSVPPINFAQLARIVVTRSDSSDKGEG